MAPDDILEQSDFPDATLNLTRDPIGRLMVAMGIVSPADKKRSGADFPHAINDDANRALGPFAFKRNKAIWEAKEEHIFWFQPELRRPLALPPPRGEPSVGPADRLCCLDESQRRR